MDSGETREGNNGTYGGPSWSDIKRKLKPTQALTVHLPLDVLLEVKQVQEDYHKRSRNDTIVQLVQMALYLLKRKDMVQDMGPTQFEEWRDMLTSHQLVDWAHDLEWYQLSVINEIITSEVKSRSLAGALNNPGAKNATRKF